MGKSDALSRRALILITIAFTQLLEATTDTSDWKECKIISDPVKIVVLTYHRSGSSYVGELLASQGNASYYFEPIFYSDYMLKNRTAEGRRDFLQRIMSCDIDLLDAVRNKRGMWIVRKFLNDWSYFRNATHNSDQISRSCRCSPIQVFKTIRLRLSEVLPMLEATPNLKIVHLVRDPRARYASAGAPGGYWSDKEKSADTICSEMQTDLDVQSPLLTDSNYVRIRYEDVVADPVNKMRAVYRQLLGSDAAANNLTTYVTSHAAVNGTNEVSYYSTFRPSSFDPNHWRTSLSQDAVKGIQEQCGSLIKSLGYNLTEY